MLVARLINKWALIRFGAKRRELTKESEPEKTASYLEHP